jgi:hypothetical protein
MNEYPYNHLLKKDVHILLSGQKKTFLDNVRSAVDSLEMRDKISRHAKAFISEKYSFLNKDMVNSYITAFI